MISQEASSGPVTATGTHPRNVDGQAIAITVFSTVKWWGRLWLPLVFLYARLRPDAESTLGKLSFIHFARWSLVKRIPDNGQPKVRLRYPHLYFESNFNGGWEEYIDAFSFILTRGMTLFWGSSYGFPKPLPTGPFKDYIRGNQYIASHYYSAYPDATTTMVLQALEVEAQLAPLRDGASGMSDEAFAAAWQRFVTSAQGCL